MAKTESIELTKKQFFLLMKLVFIGQWIVCAQKLESEFTEEEQEYTEVKDLIYSYAEKFGLKRYVDYCEECGGRHFSSADFEFSTDVHTRIDDYEEEAFWHILVDRLARTHILKDYGIKKLKKMDEEELFEILDEYLTKYDIEVTKNGVKNMLIE